jgi:hypothetical protein
MKQLTSNVFVENGIRGLYPRLCHTSDGIAPRAMKLNVANLYDYLTGADIHSRS